MADLRLYVYSVNLDSGAGVLNAQAMRLYLGGSTPALAAQGQKTMADSIPVVLASDESTLTVDTELPAAALLADATATPTTVLAGGCLMIYDGAATKWNMARGTVAAGLLVDTELPAAAALTADGLTPTAPIVGACLYGYNSGGSVWDRVQISSGALSVSVGVPTSPTTDYQTAAPAAGAVGTLTTAEAGGKKLTAVEVWSSAACKVTLHTVDNGVESAILVVGGFPAFGSFQYKPPHKNYIALGTTAGLDAFRANVTNLDDAIAASVYATFHFES